MLIAVICVLPRDLYSILDQSVGFPINKHSPIIRDLDDMNLTPGAAIDLLISPGQHNFIN